jgi:omega-6 fatty acid desaturase (delta-12 desaturase)
MAVAEIPQHGLGSVAEPASEKPDLTSFHERRMCLPVLVFSTVFAAWIALLASGLLLGGLVFRAALVVPLTLVSGQLFMIGHDAAHGSLTRVRRVNETIGHLALLPSLHVFGLWRFHHDVHHRYTNLAGRDFVWAPLAPDAYSVLPRWRQRLYRFYRHESGLGLGLNYMLEIWIPRMLWPRRGHALPGRRTLVVHTVTLAAMLVAGTVLAGLLVEVVRPQRAGDPLYWASVALFLFLIPLAATHWVIGWVVYLNHTHPDIVWYDDPAEWSDHDVQLEGSAGVVVRGTRNAVWPRRIMNHTAHHVDPGVPLRHLADAQRELATTAGDRVVSYRWSIDEFRSILADCKLYDFGTRSWVGYEAALGEQR